MALNGQTDQKYIQHLCASALIPIIHHSFNVLAPYEQDSYTYHVIVRITGAVCQWLRTLCLTEVLGS